MLKKSLISIFAIIILIFNCISFSASENETLVYYSNQFDRANPYIIIDDNGKVGGFKYELNFLLFEGSNYKVINPENELQKSECIEILGWNAKNLSLSNYDATKPLFSCFYSFYASDEKSISNISSENNLSGYEIGVFGKDYAFYKLTELGYSPNCYNTLDDLIFALDSGEIDYIYADELVINTYLNSKNLYSKYYQSKYKNEVDMVLYIAKDNPEFLSFLNKRIDEIKKDYNYEMLYMQYFNNHTKFYRLYTTAITYTIILIILLAVALTFLVLYRHIRKKYIRRIKISDECINKVAECNNSMVVFWKTDFSHISANPVFLKYTGLSQEKLTKQYVVETLYGKDMSIMSDDDYISLKIERNIPSKVKSKTGLFVDVVWSNYPIHAYADGTFLVLSVGADVTAVTSLKSSLFEQNMELNISEARYRFALECADIGVFEFDTSTPFTPLYISSIGRNILGLSDNQNILIEDIPALFASDKSKTIAKFISKLSTSAENNTAFEIKTAPKYGGKHISLSFNKVKLNGQDTTKVTGTIIDISRKIEKNKLIEKAAFYDPLTGIFNKEKFIIEGNTHIEATANGKFALIRFNISHFRKMKELAGSIGAETILKEIALNVNRILFNNSIFARIENDDFAIIKDYSDLSEIDKFMSILFKCIENLKLDVLHNEKLEIYAGISLYPTDASNIIDLMEYAELSMHTAGSEDDLDKYAYYSDKIKTIVEGKRSIETNLLSAVTNNEFEVYYQPKVSLTTNKMIGLEALIRWNHPQKGFLTPNHFIPIAEKNGNIVKIDEWVLQQACIQNKLWQTMGYKPLVVSVNVSASQFYLTDVVATIKHALETSQLDPKWLEIEITETMAHRDLDKAIDIIKRIKALGVSVSMDDFGTGYSSLSAIKVLPIDILKIDRSLIIDIVESETSKIVTNSIISLAKKLNLSLITEGIETKEQADIIREMGCDAAQGYLYYRPSKASETEKNFEKIS